MYSDYESYDDDVICTASAFSLGAWLTKHSLSGSTNSLKRSQEQKREPTINPDLHSSIKHLKPAYYWPGENSLAIDLGPPKVLSWALSALNREPVVAAPTVRVGDRVKVFGYKGDATVRSVGETHFSVSMLVMVHRYWGSSLTKQIIKLNKCEYLQSWKQSKWYCPQNQELRKKLRKQKHEEMFQKAWVRRQEKEPAWNHGPTMKEKKAEMKRKIKEKNQIEREANQRSKHYKQETIKLAQRLTGECAEHEHVVVYKPTVDWEVKEKQKYIGVSTKKNRHNFMKKVQREEEAPIPAPSLKLYFEINKKKNITLRNLLSLSSETRPATAMQGALHDGFLYIDLHSKFTNVPIFLNKASEEKYRLKVLSQMKERRKKEKEQNENINEIEEQEEIIEEPVVIEVAPLVKKIEIQPTQTIADLLVLYGGSSISPEDIFNPKVKKYSKSRKNRQNEVLQSEEPEEAKLPEDHSKGVYFPVIDTEEAKRNLFFSDDNLPEASEALFFNESTLNKTNSELKYFSVNTISEPEDIFWSQLAENHQPRGFVFVQ